MAGSSHYLTFLWMPIPPSLLRPSHPTASALSTQTGNQRPMRGFVVDFDIRKNSIPISLYFISRSTPLRPVRPQRSGAV